MFSFLRHISGRFLRYSAAFGVALSFSAFGATAATDTDEAVAPDAVVHATAAQQEEKLLQMVHENGRALTEAAILKSRVTTIQTVCHDAKNIGMEQTCAESLRFFADTYKGAKDLPPAADMLRQVGAFAAQGQDRCVNYGAAWTCAPSDTRTDGIRVTMSFGTEDVSALALMRSSKDEMRTQEAFGFSSASALVVANPDQDATPAKKATSHIAKAQAKAKVQLASVKVKAPRVVKVYPPRPEMAPGVDVAKNEIPATADSAVTAKAPVQLATLFMPETQELIAKIQSGAYVVGAAARAQNQEQDITLAIRPEVPNSATDIRVAFKEAKKALLSMKKSGNAASERAEAELAMAAVRENLVTFFASDRLSTTVSAEILEAAKVARWVAGRAFRPTKGYAAIGAKEAPELLAYVHGNLVALQAASASVRGKDKKVGVELVKFFRRNRGFKPELVNV